MAVSEQVRLLIEVVGSREALEQLRLLQTAQQQTRQSFKQTTDAVVQSAQRLRVEAIDLIVRASKEGQVSISQLDETIKKLDRSFRLTGSELERRRIARLSNELRGIRRSYQDLIDKQRQSNLQGRVTSQVTQRANIAVIDLSRGLQDLAFGWRSVINNVDPFFGSMQRVRASSEAAGISVKQGILTALTGPTGLFLAFSVASTVAIAFGDDIVEAFSKGTISAKELQQITETILDDILDIQAVAQEGLKFTVDTEEIGLRVEDVERIIRNIRAEQSEINRLQLGGATFGAESVRLREREEEAVKAVVVAEEALARLKAAGNEQDLREIANRFATELGLSAGLSDAEKEFIDEENRLLDRSLQQQFRGERRLQREAVQAARRLQRARIQLNNELGRLRLLGIQDEEQREFDALQRRFDRALLLAADLGDRVAEQEIGQILGQAVDRFVRERAEEQAEILRKLSEDIARDELAVQRALDRENEVRRKEIERDRLDSIQVRINVEKRAQREFDQAQRRALRVARRLADDIIGTLLAAARFERQFTDLDEELERDRLDQQERDLVLSLRNREIAQRDFDLQVRAIAQDRADFEKELERDRRGFIEQSVRGLVDVVIEEGQRQLAAFIAQQIIARLFGQASLRTAAAETEATMAEIAAAAIPAAGTVSIATSGGAAVAGAAAILLAVPIIAAAFASFKEAGFTGHGKSDKVAGLVHAGEFVFPADVVAGRPGPFYALMNMLRGSTSIEDIVGNLGSVVRPGTFPVGGLYQDGGFAVAQRGVSSVAVLARGGDEADLGDLLELVGVLVQEVRFLTSATQELGDRPIEMPVGPRKAREITELGQSQSRLVRPSRG